MNPFLRREVLGLFRARWAFWLLLVSVAASCLLPLFHWPQSEDQLEAGSAKAVFLLFATQLTALLILLPAVAAGAIAGERERGTYDLLFMTPLPARSIVLAKTAAPVLFVLVGLAATAPPVSALYLLGGINFSTILKCYAVTAMSVLVTTLVSLVQSARCRTTMQAATQGLVWSTLWTSGPFLILGAVAATIFKAYRELLLIDSIRDGEQNSFVATVHRFADSWGRLIFLGSALLAGLAFAIAPIMVALSFGAVAGGLSPYSALHFVVNPEQAGGREIWLVYIAVAALVTVVQLRVLARAAGMTPEEPQTLMYYPRQPIGMPRAEAMNMADRPPSHLWVLVPVSPRSFSTGAVLAWGQKGLRLFSNPVLLQELRTQFHGSALYRQALFWITAGLCGFAGLTEWGSKAVFFIAAAVALVLLPAAGAAGFAREAEAGNLDLLRSTALSAREILHGKLGSALLSAATLLSAVVWMAGLGALHDFNRWKATWAATTADLFLRTTALGGALVFLVVLSVFCSVHTRRSLHGILLSYAGAFVVQVGTALLASFVLTGPPDASMSIREVTGTILRATSPFLLFDRPSGWYSLAPDHKVAQLAIFTLSNFAAAGLLYWASLRRVERVLRLG